MSLSHRVRARARRSALLVLATTGAAAAAFGVGAAPASAHPASTWEINNWRHFAGLTQEAGSDEFYLLTINFQVQLGVKDSLRVWTNSPYEIDNIDDEEYHSVRPEMGQGRYSISEWDPTRMIQLPWENQLDPNRLGNKGPWIFGSFTQMMEKDTSPWSSINAVHRNIASAIQSNLKTPLESLTPTVMFAEALAGGIIGFIDPNDAKLRADVLDNYLVGKVTKIALDIVGKTSIWQGVTSLFDDRIGNPHFSVVLGVENIPFFPIGDIFNNFSKSRGLFSANGDQLMALPFAQRDYKQQYKGDGARYVMDVRARRL